MFTYHKLAGTWRIAQILGVTGDPYVPGRSVGILWVLPPSGTVESTTVKGCINTFPKNNMGDRECTHRHGEGNLYGIGIGNITYSTISPYSDPSKQLTLCTYRYIRDGSASEWSLVGPSMSGMSLSYDLTLPDHTIGDYQYRNISMSVRTIGVGVVTSIHSHEFNYLNTGWKKDSSDQKIQLDPVNFRYRYAEGSYWGSWVVVPNARYSSSGATSESIRSPRDWSRVAAIMNTYFIDRDRDYYGDLAIRCADSARCIDMNSIEYIRDLGNFVSEMKNLRSLLGKKTSLKKISSLYLSYKYGARLTISDTIELLDVLQYNAAISKTHDFSWVRAAESASETSVGIKRSSKYNYKVYYRPHSNAFLRGISNIQSAGLYPSPKAAWELIPYSFVADWFTDLSSRLNTYDADLTWSTHEVLGTVVSAKHVYGSINPHLIGMMGYVGDMSFVDYCRMTPPVMFRPNFFSDTPLVFKNYVELTALILAKGRK